MIPPQLTGSPAGQVLSILQRHGPVSIKDLEQGLGVTATAVRQQIAGLLADGYIQQEIERAGRGRPKHVYSLTPKGRSLFPHHYDEFTNSLLREISAQRRAGEGAGVAGTHGPAHGSAVRDPAQRPVFP